jgi:hypothetical protein
MGNSVDLQDTFLNISDEIQFTLPCTERHLELLIMTYADFDRKYIICPEKTLVVYGLLKDVDDYIDFKLGIFPLNVYQQNQMAIAKNKFIEAYLKFNEISFKSGELLNQYNDEKEELISLDLDPLKIKNVLLENENMICFPGKEKEGIEKSSKKIQKEMDSYTKEPISIFSGKKEVMYNPESDKLLHMMEFKDEMITVPDIGNTQVYSDDESAKSIKVVQKMHNFMNKTVLNRKSPASRIKYEFKYPRGIDKEEEDKVICSDDEWVLEDNGQQLASIKRNKKDDPDKDPDGMGFVRSSLVFEILASTFASSSNLKVSQRDKQLSNDNNNKKKYNSN